MTDVDITAIRAGHSDPLIIALCEEVERLRSENADREREFLRLVARNADNQILRDKARDEVDHLRARLRARQ